MIYVTRWCSDCARARRFLERSGIPFVEIDIEQTPSAEAAMRSLNGGSGKVPTVLICREGRSTALVEPTEQILSSALLAEEQ